jgi:phenylalanyl-tRNA synthetase alpha chain
MSGPNSNYDPVEVTPLHADQVEAMRDEAVAAIDSAADLDELKQVRLAHAGDRSPLGLANREIGALPTLDVTPVCASARRAPPSTRHWPAGP